MTTIFLPFLQAIGVHAKMLQSYLLAYGFHLLIEGAVTNLTNKLVQSVTISKSHKD